MEIMTKEEYEFYEDFILTGEVAKKEEVAYSDDSMTVITHSGEVKLNPELKEFKMYLENKVKVQRDKYYQEKRRKSIHLVK